MYYALALFLIVVAGLLACKSIRTEIFSAAQQLAAASPAWLKAVIAHHMSAWLWLSVLLVVPLVLWYPQLREVFVVKTLQVGWGGYIGLWIARSLFKMFSLDDFVTDASGDAKSPADIPQAIAFAAVVISVALVVGLAILAVALGA